MEIKPAILETSLENIREKLMHVQGLVPLVQIDMCDGVFVPSQTYGYAAEEPVMEVLLAELIKSKLNVEYDLMINFKENQLFLDRWLAFIHFSKPQRVLFHFSSLNQDQWPTIFNSIDERSTEILMAVSLQDDVVDILKIFAQYNFKGIQIMGIMKIGFSGEELHAKTYILLDELAKHTDTLFVDGGVTLENAPTLKKHGATSLATTSALFKSESIVESLSAFRAI